MDTPVNYLTTLDTSVFKHFLRFVGHPVELRLFEAYSLSQADSEARGHFLRECSQPAVVQECAYFQFSMRREQMCSFNILSLEQKTAIREHKERLKHVTLQSDFFDLDKGTYLFLKKHLAQDNPALESLALVMNTTLNDNEPVGAQTQHRIAMGNVTFYKLLQQLKAAGVSVSLHLTVMDTKVALDFCKNFIFYALSGHVASLILRQGRLPLVGPTMLTAGLGLFSTLRVLDLNAVSLSTSVLLGLAGTSRDKEAPLRTLAVRVTASALQFHYRKVRMPNVTEEAWERLAERFPLLQVHCDVRNVDSKSLLQFVKPAAPVHEFSLYTCNLNDLKQHISGCRLFSRTLRLFECRTDRTCADNADFDLLLSRRFCLTEKYQFAEGDGLKVIVW